VSVLPVTVLVVAKAPVPGLAKTRLAAAVGGRLAAEIAAAALLDTLDAVAATPVAARVVALTGELDAAANADDIADRLKSFTVITQRGNDFADRLANAHADAADGSPVLQIGMDTPQVTADLLAGCGQRLGDAPAVLGPARDGGWWALGLRTPAAARCLRTVAMSQPDTGTLTLAALRRCGLDVGILDELADVDVVADIATVRDACPPTSRFVQVTLAAGL
jgi:glycosyltransferase A (GT-A) superfamily protein (DUF2064 family)